MGSGEIGEMIGSGGPPGRPSRGPGNKKALLKKLHKMMKAHQAREDSESDFEPESESDDGPPFGSGEIIGQILGALGEIGSGEIGEMIGSGGPPGRPSRGPGNKKALLKKLHKMKKAHHAKKH